MCGFISYEQRTITENDEWLSNIHNLAEVLHSVSDYIGYPAFGGDITRKIPIIIFEQGNLKLVNATWWFDASVDEHGNTQLGRRTTFNARNLESPFWRHSLLSNRGLALASAIGESRVFGKTKHQYLMRSQQPFILGVLYRRLNNGDYVCAVITRDSHPKMEPYHDKAFPLFLPNQEAFLQTWLKNKAQLPEAVEQLLAMPKLYPNLHVQRVKSYKTAIPVGNISANLVSDSPELLR